MSAKTLRKRRIASIFQHYYPEGGWGYVILMCGLLVQVFAHGLQLSYGMFMPIVINIFRSTIHNDTDAGRKQLCEYYLSLLNFVVIEPAYHNLLSFGFPSQDFLTPFFQNMHPLFTILLCWLYLMDGIALTLLRSSTLIGLKIKRCRYKVPSSNMRSVRLVLLARCRHLSIANRNRYAA